MWNSLDHHCIFFSFVSPWKCCRAILHCLDVGRLRDFDTGPPDFADDDFDPDGTVNDSLPGFRRLMEAE